MGWLHSWTIFNWMIGEDRFKSDFGTQVSLYIIEINVKYCIMMKRVYSVFQWNIEGGELLTFSNSGGSKYFGFFVTAK